MNIDQMRPLYKRLPDIVAKTYLHHIWRMAHVYQFGWIQAITGGVRTGKSMTICTLADLLCMHELDEYNFAFKPKHYLRNLNQCETGEPQIWSELGTALSARRWRELPNMLMGEVVQTMMIKYPVVFADAPDMTFVDVQVRKLIYAYAEAQRWEDSPVKLWVYNLNINRKEGDIYYPHPVARVNGTVVKIRAINMKCKAADEVWIKYDEQQRQYKDALSRRNQKILEDLEKDLSVEGNLTVYDFANLASKNPSEYKRNGVFHIMTIMNKFNVGYNRACQIKTLLEDAQAKAQS